MAAIKGAELKDSNALLYLQSFFLFHERAAHSSVSRPFNLMSLPMCELTLMLIEFYPLARWDRVDPFLDYPEGAVLPLAGVRLKVLLQFLSFFEVQARG